MNELEALVALSSIPYLGPVKIKLLLKTFGSSVNALNAAPSLIEELKGFGSKIALGFRGWQDNSRWKEDLKVAKQFGVQIIPFTSPEYPQELLELDDYPLMLYVLGDLKIKNSLNIGVVGTRQASIYGLEAADKISTDLGMQGFTIVSGLARGIDTAAHKGALKRGKTLAVIGSGIGDIYPKENLRLAEEIAKNGAVISEFSMMTPPERQNFPRRNRIVSGLSRGTLLIEAPIKSGAMITMEMALSQKKKLFAIPGRIDNENFAGNHLLIKKGHAKLVEHAADISQSFESFDFVSSTRTVESQPILSNEEQELFDLLPKEEFSIELLTELTKRPIAKLNVLLMCLMLKKAIKEYPGKMYKKMNRG